MDYSMLDAQTGGLHHGSQLQDLPAEILDLIRHQQSPNFLDTLAASALQPALTLPLFAQFESVIADSCARWISNTGSHTQKNEIIEAFARILPLAPHLSTFLEKYLLETTSSPRDPSIIQCLGKNWSGNQHDTELQRILLAAWRLLNFDRYAFSKSISGSRIQTLLAHPVPAVRYLAIRIFCQLQSVSDWKLEAMIEQHVGRMDAVMGEFDGATIDYGFLSLFEEKRLRSAASVANAQVPTDLLEILTQPISPLVVRSTNILVPRPKGPPGRLSSLVSTETTVKNRQGFATALLSSSPILLHGLAGSGKTSLVDDFARELGVEETMVTLHLNEQTDAKMLIGMYTTGSTPGSFTWRAGVLTTAVREGRWVFIEDLDRAPNEVISVILPLIERGELSIPSRSETIRAAAGFKLIASIRTSLNVSGLANPPALHMLGARLWQRVPVGMPSQDEFRQIINGTHPILREFLPEIINVYERLYALSHKPSFASKSRTSLGRPISPRDLLKWCRRLDGILIAAGSNTGREPITDATKYEMFMEAADCFAGNLQTEDARRTVISCIAVELHVDPQRVEHYLTSHIPRYEDREDELVVGRVRLPKSRATRDVKPLKKARPFANTTHAKRLLEQVGVAVRMSEPVLLVGETGIGKTTVVQQLADSLGFKLTAVNLSQQSEVGDLLGGYKPVNVRNLAIPLKDEFDELFSYTGISQTKNQKYLDSLGKCVAKSQWSRASKLWREAPKMFEKIVSELTKKEAASKRDGGEQPIKRRKTESKLESLLRLKPRWDKFSQSLEQFDVQISGGSKGFAFSFVEGNIVKAARNGDWVLLDEINLASPDTLESIADLLHNGSGTAPSILLSETGEIERVRAHPNFRIFGAMNPATDVGKRDLPMGLRSRFTELYVDSPDRDLEDLLTLIRAYLKGTSSNDERAAHDVAQLYMQTKRYADEKRLVDGANQVPHFSLRTLTRVLSFVTDIAPAYGLRRALYEGFAMGFLTLLDRESEKMLIPLIDHHLLKNHGNAQSLLSQTPRHPDDGKQYVRFVNKKRDRQYWMLQGMETPEEQPHYIITPFVERNMLNLVRATSTRRFPVLVQGPTSSGKTSMIEYLAKHSGNKFVRINNHEHTDLQEYLGTYVSGTDGQLRFQEGLLVQALRQGHWIVLDELNLAPTDVLEALNRLLDDNRELLIPETQEIVRPHDNFMLFATQNPPGLYGGRKTLSRAFRNRFLELHFDDIPEDELDFILEKRSQKVAPSDCRRIVAVYKELSRLRQSNRLFEQKDSFATLRDLFRWALRDADNREQLATNGYMLLGERVRNPDERKAVKDIIESVMKVKIDTNVLYDASLSPEITAYNETSNAQGVVWTQAMRRLYVLVAHALRNNEPVLLVGETGCGKTTVCQMLAEAFKKDLHIVNAHQNTETGDLIGAQRPVRNRAAVLELLKQDLILVFNGLNIELPGDADLDALLSEYQSMPAETSARVPHALQARIQLNQVKAKALFEWSDGSLVQAMRDGQLFLLDEISLADDSVLERLNSVLESQRTILLAEKGVDDSFVKAADGFQFFATMNPGGDYGKRELSPALRNRFTEIWVPSLSEHEDVFQIVDSKLQTGLKPFSKAMVHFAEWFGKTYRSSSSTSISVRDVLAWVKFMNGCSSQDPYFAVLHGAAMVYIDTLGANPAAMLAINPETIRQERTKCLEQLGKLLSYDVDAIYARPITLTNGISAISVGDFSIPKYAGSDSDPGFAFNAPTTKLNAMRVIRALQVQKPILIEGSPGVGKTTLVAALARLCNRPLTRINLSEQTDLMDLFGSDVPVEGAEAGHFAWRDAPFLQAMQRGEWVLLDEMNLASQSVLEGLNACLDHRGEVYISELDQTFKRHPDFSVFAAQNPHHQGGGRKGLPASFVNRFTVVYADVFQDEDLALICKHNFPAMPEELVTTVIRFVSQLEKEVVHKRRFGSQGGPWEFNLRDILRWLQLLSSSSPLLAAGSPADFLNLIFRQRFRTPRDRLEIDNVFAEVFGTAVPFRHLFHNISSTAYQVGQAYLPRQPLMQRLLFPTTDPINRLPEIESVMICIQQNLPCILVGPSGCGKTTILQHIAAASGNSLVVFPLNADVDTMDLVGGFEQVDPQRSAADFLARVLALYETHALATLPSVISDDSSELLEMLRSGAPMSPTYFHRLASIFRNLEQATSTAQFGELASTCSQFAQKNMSVENARFEWVDGILIKALEQGKWLVLDNANLCSASVLDRLNSLLEPNGFLSINEHCGPDGEPKIVKPHPDFRVFLTMDARFGELSRAMRNRAVEIFLEPLVTDACTQNQANVSAVRPEASLQRYRNLSDILDKATTDGQSSVLLENVALDNLAWSDLPLLSRYSQAMAARGAQLPNSVQHYLRVYHSEQNQAFRAAIGSMLDELAAKNGLSSDFKDAQIIHPLQNSSLVPLLQQSSYPAQVYWLAACFELQLSLLDGAESHKAQQAAIDTLKPSQMNRLQRSLVSERIPSVAKDSTVHVNSFLVQTMNYFMGFLITHIKADQEWKHQKKTLSSLLQYWWDTYTLVTSPKFEEATFQAHLAIGRDLLASISKQYRGLDINAITSKFERDLQASFDSGFKLGTGLSMEVLWKRYRPTVVSQQVTMQVLGQMQQLAARFDALRWTSTISVAELGAIMTSLVKAYQIVLTSDVDGVALVKTLSDELEKLEAGIGAQNENIKPFLTSQFEALRQYKVLESLRSGKLSDRFMDTDTVVLANHATASEMHLSSSTSTSLLLQSIDYLWGCGEGLLPITDTFSSGFLRRLNAVGGVDLKSLKLLESELPIMGEKLVLSSASLCRNQFTGLGDTLLQLVSGVVAAHGDSTMASYTEWIDTVSAKIDLKTLPLGRLSTTISLQLPSIYFVDNFEQQLPLSPLSRHIDRSVLAIQAAGAQPMHGLQFLALAWVHFAAGSITLYVPDRAFDPDKRQRLERERHERLAETLNGKLDALRTFETMFSGQSSNLRCQLIEEEISETGAPSKVLQEIYRPEISELDQLQGEFRNLLKTVLSSAPDRMLERYFGSGDEGALQEVKLLQSNVLQIIRRLTDRFQAYSDLTTPVVSILRCLQIGLSMATSSALKSSAKNTQIQQLSSVTPFLGGGPVQIDDEFVKTQPMEYLALISTTVATESISSFRFDPELRQSLFSAFHSAYNQWTERLDADRIEAENRAGLYRFRGSAEDEEEDDLEEFEELFPSFDAKEDDSDEKEPTAGPSKSKSEREKQNAVILSGVHASIFLSAAQPTESIKSLVRQISSRIGALHDDASRSAQANLTSALLSGPLLLLNDQIEALSPTAAVPLSYNFYTSPNLPESRKLVNLIHRIQTRFRELQGVDEIGHMQPLEDVLIWCRESLQFAHTEPIAKIITKVEKLYEEMDRWQNGGLAPAKYGAESLYNELTQTIISWRRLELSTWNKLFDMEIQKCDDDARAWWFLAYQVVVAAPLEIYDTTASRDELLTYAHKLLKDLEIYFSTAILGQFMQRIQLLRQLQKHLELIMIDVPAMTIIHGALTNFISLYARYEAPVLANLKTGRGPLEKAMHDTIKFASWKDTRIEALRESAKKSHHKLFKFVRKFRAHLGQPMEVVLKSGLPDQPSNDSEHPADSAPHQQPIVDISALVFCAKAVPGWASKPKRFTNISQTVSLMVDMAQFPSSAVESSEYLDSFLSNIITSNAELQKATPSILTEENKVMVKHLKTRKRKLFADTLKELRQMGISFNLGVNALAKQESLSIVLANTDHLALTQDFDVQGIEYYFHKSVDIAPRARAAIHEHNQDLSGAEVARSAGFLEGLLQLSLAQHNTMSREVKSMKSVQCVIAMVKALWAPASYEIKSVTEHSTHDKLLRWLPNILNVGLDLIKIHAKLGKTDPQVVLDSISSWADIFVDLTKRWDAGASLPSDIMSNERKELEQAISDAAQQFNMELAELSEQRPDLHFILVQLLPWTKISSNPVSAFSRSASISDLDQKLATVSDTILHAIEKYKKSIIELPDSTEDPNWLIKNDATLTASINSLHSDQIVTEVEQAFEILRRLDLDNSDVSKSAAAMFAVFLPILQQYYNTIQETIMRYAHLHRTMCKTTYILGTTFVQIATSGFCTPAEEQESQSGQTEKMEGGTGLGDGEGAQDISKDIQEDEDLDELAQEPNTGERDEIEDEKDAVDMADGDMEGEMGDAEEKDDEKDDDGESQSGDEMDEEAGDVDDLDPNAVDEKMWDGDRDEADKDQEGDESKGKQDKNEQAAAQENDNEAQEGEEEEEMEGAEQGEEVKQQDEVEKHDPHADDTEVLDLPEDMDLDGEGEEESGGSDDGLNDLEDNEEEVQPTEEMADGKEEPEGENADGQEETNVDEDMDIVDLDAEDEENPGNETEEAGKNAEEESEEQQPEDLENLLRDRTDEANADAENAVPSDVQGVGEDNEENQNDKEDNSATKAQREDGGEGGDSSEQKADAAEDGEKGRQANGDAPQNAQDQTEDSSEAQPFKKLGDALEKWHRQQTQAREPADQKEQGQDQSMDPNTENSEFQHLQDEEAEADAQAMGTATEEQAHALDESMAVDPESKEMPDTFQPDEAEQDDLQHDDVMDLEDDNQPEEPSNAYEGRAGAIINQSKPEQPEDAEDARVQPPSDIEEDVEEVDTRLSHTSLDPSPLPRDSVKSRDLWTQYESATRTLSLSLTEQLRLILTPTLATKMRGDFRTGKRLNIKRIIPYIASSYKRDKIWMRRSVPSKRNYQIMLAVDDSKSMGESGSGALAFETLVMVSKSLSMLEVGEICVVGFGEQVRVAHEFDVPFSSDAGPKVFENFSFDQKRTDVTRLIRESLELFRSARQKALSTAENWQIELIISDGVCDSSEHASISQLLREAMEERIMIVFVIVDDVKEKKKGESVLDLKEAKFVKNEMTGQNQVRIERYLDTFPFQYYLVVSDVRELPGVLATLLRQWFAEVVDCSS